jgi:hypothetical protein
MRSMSSFSGNGDRAGSLPAWMAACILREAAMGSLDMALMAGGALLLIGLELRRREHARGVYPRPHR